jgi:hypothetical protein
MKNKILLATMSMTFALISFLLNHRFCWNISPQEWIHPKPLPDFRRLKFSCLSFTFETSGKKLAMTKLLEESMLIQLVQKKINKALKPPAMKRQ